MFDSIYTMFGTDEETLILLVAYSILVVIAVCYLVKFREKIKERLIFEQRRSRSTFTQGDSEDSVVSVYENQDDSEVYAEEVLGLR